jgi:O-antigen/teichoic acid export membrane protein
MAKYAPSKIVGTLGNAIIVPVYTSLLSPQEYGLYSLSIAVLSFLCIIFSDWVGLSGLRFFRQYQLTQDMPRYLTTLFMILISNLLLMFLLAYIFRENFYSFFNIPAKYFAAILILIIPVAIRAILCQLLRAQLKSIAFTLSTIINQFLTIIISILIIKYLNLGAMSLLLGMGIGITLIDILLIFQSGILRWFRLQKIEWKSEPTIYWYGIPIAATSLTTWIINQSNKLIMNNIHGFSEVGIVGVAYSLTLPILMTMFAIITVAAIPRIINMYEAKIDVRPMISRFAGYYVLVALPAVIVMSVCCVDFVHIFASSEKFYVAFKIIPYFAFGTFFLSFTDYTTLQYHLAQKTYIDFIIKLISGIVGIVLNVLLIPQYGLVGVGIATLLANFLYFLLSMVIVLPGLNLIFPRGILLKVFASLIPFSLILFVVKDLKILYTPFRLLIPLFVFYGVYFLLNKKYKKDFA